MKDFKDKVAVVTGGASGVGFAIGKKLATKGAKVILADIEEDALNASLARIESEGIPATVKVTDVTNFSSVQELASETQNLYGN